MRLVASNRETITVPREYARRDKRAYQDKSHDWFTGIDFCPKLVNVAERKVWHLYFMCTIALGEALGTTSQLMTSITPQELNQKMKSALRWRTEGIHWRAEPNLAENRKKWGAEQ